MIPSPVSSPGLLHGWRPSLWTVLTLVVALLVMTPVLFVLASVASPEGEVWQHLFTTVLQEYLFNSLGLALGVGIGTAVIGTSTAWLVTLCHFPGRRILSWALLLPLAAPAYVLAYAYTDFLEAGGWLQTTLRAIFQWQVGDYWFPPIRSFGGATVLLTLTLYPYVYMATRLAFMEQSTRALEVSRSLGCTPWQGFWRVALPLARPSLVAGISLALMETLNDYGTVSYFGVGTLTTGIYRTWYGFGDRVAASQLAALTLVLIAALLVWEQGSRHRRRYYQSFAMQQRPQPYVLKGWRAAITLLWCSWPILLGFGVPASLLLRLVGDNWDQAGQGRFWSFAGNSIVVSLLAALLAVTFGIALAYGQRQSQRQPMGGLVAVATRIASLGYGIPGAVIAVGILVPLGALDNKVDALMTSLTGKGTGLLFSGTITALLFAYLVRFLAVAYSTIASSLSKIKPHLDEASRSLGQTTGQTLWRVHLPLLWPGVLTATLLVFVDVMKELPATIVIRPFNFETLAVRAYQMASDERLAEAALPSLAIVVVGLLPVLLLNWRMQQAGDP